MFSDINLYRLLCMIYSARNSKRFNCFFLGQYKFVYQHSWILISTSTVRIFVWALCFNKQLWINPLATTKSLRDGFTMKRKLVHIRCRGEVLFLLAEFITKVLLTVWQSVFCPPLLMLQTVVSSWSTCRNGLHVAVVYM